MNIDETNKTCMNIQETWRTFVKIHEHAQYGIKTIQNCRSLLTTDEKYRKSKAHYEKS